MYMRFSAVSVALNSLRLKQLQHFQHAHTAHAEVGGWYPSLLNGSTAVKQASDPVR